MNSISPNAANLRNVFNSLSRQLQLTRQGGVNRAARAEVAVDVRVPVRSGAEIAVFVIAGRRREAQLGAVNHIRAV
jgi:hypothetical protein